MSTASAQTLLEARDLTAVLPGDAGPLSVLDGLSLGLSAGEVVDVAGPSGCGKTTLLRALARLLPNVTGALALDGAASTDFAPERWRSLVALLPQKPAIVCGDVATNLMLPWQLNEHRDEDKPSSPVLRAALDSVALHDVALERDAARLSVGQQARVALVRVVLTSPRVLLLDEPDAALDHASAEALAMVLRDFTSHGGGVIRARHRAGDGLASRRLLLSGGHLSEEASQ